MKVKILKHVAHNYRTLKPGMVADIDDKLVPAMVERGLVKQVDAKKEKEEDGAGKSAVKMIAALLGVLSMFLGAPSARAQVSATLPVPIQWQTNMPASSSSNTPTAFATNTANWFRLKANQGLAVQMTLSCTNAAATNGPVTVGFDLSVDGTNFTTIEPLTYVMNPNGTTSAIGWTNFPPAAINNTRFIRIGSLRSDNTNVVQLKSVVFGTFPNNGQFY